LADLVNDSPLLPQKRDLLSSDVVQMSHHGQTNLSWAIACNFDYQ